MPLNQPRVCLLLILILVLGCRAEQPSIDNTPTPLTTAVPRAEFIPRASTPQRISPRTPPGPPVATQPASPATPLPSATPTPAPLPPLSTVLTYTVRTGDTPAWIAEFFGANVTQLGTWNPMAFNESGDLLAGSVLDVPLNRWRIAPGETLGMVALRSGVDTRTILSLNPQITNPDFVMAGTILLLQPERALDCSQWALPPAADNSVREWTVTSAEALFCARRELDLSITTIYKAQAQCRNAFATQSFTGPCSTLLLPPTDGALHLVAAEDDGLWQVSEIVARYQPVTGRDGSVGTLAAFGWDGAAAPADQILQAGDRLFISGAHPREGFGRYTFGAAPPLTRPVVAAAETPSAPGTTPRPPIPGYSYAYPLPAGDPPPGAFVPSSPAPWRGDSRSDPGWCPAAPGYGWTGSALWPTASTDVNPERSFRAGHTALDIYGTIGDPVVAAETGVVVWAGESRFGGGEMVILAHGNTWLTMYMHLDTISVSCGQEVARGAPIGTLGTTETSWAHLHFEIRWNGFALNPNDFVR